MKNKIWLLVLTAFFLAASLYAQELDSEKTIKFLSKYFCYGETNYYYLDESNEIKDLFYCALKNIYAYTSEEKEALRLYAFSLLYNNSIIDYEDAVDEYRRNVKRSMSYMILAVLSDEFRYEYFLQMAKKSIDSYIYYVDYNLLYEQLILIDVLSVFLSEQVYGYNNYMELQKSVDDSYKTPFEYAKENKEHLSDEFLSDLFKLKGLQK